MFGYFCLFGLRLLVVDASCFAVCCFVGFGFIWVVTLEDCEFYCFVCLGVLLGWCFCVDWMRDLGFVDCLVFVVFDVWGDLVYLFEL